MSWYKLILRDPRARAGAIILIVLALIALLAPVLAPYAPDDISFGVSEGPSAAHPLGTTTLGQDVLSQALWGSRISLLVGLACGTVISLIGVVMGLLSGYLEGVLGQVLTMITNIFLVIPSLPLMIILAAFLRIQSILPVILVISFTGWPWGARVLRSQVLSLKSRDFVRAAKVTGEGSTRIVFSEIMPNMLGLIAANFFGAALHGVLSEAGLEFLGLGNVSLVSWGTMLYWAQNNQALIHGQWLWVLAPGLLIASLGTAFGLLNFAIDQAVNPKLRGASRAPAVA
jgi:ABC-type dipeptide/oligopeptide/nickel transport system permease subunit